MSLDTATVVRLGDSAAVGPVTATDRIQAIDILRGVALFGVLTVNLLGEFRVSLFQQFLPEQPVLPSLDSAVQTFLSVFVEMKAFALFSILFGVGLAIQSERLVRSGSRWRLLVRRLLALLTIGLIHLLLIWNGDILTEYAIAGLIVLPLLWLPAWTTALMAVGLLTFYIVMPILPLTIAWPAADALQQHVADATRIYATGSYSEILRFSWQELAYIVPLHESVFPRTLGLFCVGMLAWPTEVLRKPHKRLLIAVTATGLIFGALLSLPALLGGSASLNVQAAIAPCLSNAAGIFMGLGYGAAIISLVEFTSACRILRVFAPAGRMAFTNYLLQSVIFSWLFFGYGLGYFGRLGLFDTFVRRSVLRVPDGIERVVAAPFSLRTGGVGVAHADVRQAPAHDVGCQAVARGSRTQPDD